MLFNLFLPSRERGPISYDEHVDDIVQCLLVVPEHVLPRLLKAVRERVKGEMYLEVMERWQAARAAK